jgi:hypothetical protein
MLKYFSKIAMDILPSVTATIIVAYIVNHYIVARPATDAPAAAAVSSVNPKKVTAKADSKPAETSSDLSNLPEVGVRAKGISEKAISEKAASEKAASEKVASEKVASERAATERAATEKAASEKAALEKSAAEKPTEKPADKPAETASIPADSRRHQSGPREKTVAKTVPVPAVVPTVATPDVATPNTAPPVEAAIAPEDHVNANEIARVALERLRGTSEGQAHTMEASRTPDTPRLVSNPPAAAPAVRPLPPPIMVSTPGNDRFDSTPGSSRNPPPYAAAAPADDPRRPTPPADIPTAPPLDLRAEAVEPPPARAHTNVAEDMLSSVKSVFHAVLPKPSSD